MGIAPKRKLEPKEVSKWFRLDWQYVLRAGRLPAVKPIAAVLVAVPIFGDLPAELPVNTTGFWFIWLGSIVSLLAFAFAWARCPTLVREYESYKAYEDFGHSHRWIGWLFYLHREEYVDPKAILKETIDKNVALLESSACDPSALADFFREMRTKPTTGDYEFLKPKNVDRDLYVGFWLNGSPFVVALQEDDPKLEAKIRELFWILLSYLLSSRRISRFVVWGLYALTMALFIVALVMNLATPLDGLYEALDKYLFGWPV